MTNDKKPDAAPEDDAPKSADAQPKSDETDLAVDEDGELLPGPMELLEIEIADLKDRYLRQAADMENLRKRTERERSDIKKYAVSEFARDILPLSDNFQRAIDAVPPEAAEQDEALKSFLEGVKMNERELQKVLERHGVTQLAPAGEKFDPNQHQAVQQIEDSDLPNNTVVEVFQVGYVIADRVLRPAVVSVAKNAKVEGGAKAQGGEKTGSAHKEPPLSLPDTDAEPGGEDSQEIGSNIDKNA